MQPRAPRFWLRFDSGPRQGETLPLREGTLSVGRRSANGIALGDGSVSGFHAELHVGADGVEVVDLESTNGTRVGDEKVQRSRLAHGDVVTFGSVAATLVDEEFAGGPTPALPGASGPEAGEALGRVEASQVAAAGRRGLLAPLLLVLALGGGGAALYLLRDGGAGPAGPARPEPVPGNLVGDGVFEGDGAAGWESAAGATEAFTGGQEFAATGLGGLGVVLDEPPAGEGVDEATREAWSYASSPRVAVGSRGGLELRASLQCGDATVARVGLAFDSERGEGPPFVAWTRAVPAADAFDELELVAAVPPGYDHVAVAVAARGVGWAALDDVVLLEAAAPGALAEVDGLAAHGYGSDATTLTVVRSGRTLLPALDFGRWGAAGARGGARGSWRAAADGRSLTLAPGGGAERVEALVVTADARAEGDAGGWLASLGAEGYAAHANAFEVDGATGLLIGRGFDLLRVGLEPPTRAEGRVRDGALVLGLDGAPALSLTGSFGEERAAARELRERAEAAERDGRPGEALALWQRLLDELPYEAELVARAETARTRLVQAGLERVDGVRREVERARFFGLADLYEETLRSARTIASSYAGTEVAREAQAAAREIEGALAGLSTGGADDDVARVRGVLRALDDDAGAALRAHVRAALTALEGGGGDEAPTAAEDQATLQDQG